MSNKRQMIIDRLWQIKKAAEEIDILCHNGIDCDECPAFGRLSGCGGENIIADMEIPEE